jgi:hypothetical protein
MILRVTPHKRPSIEEILDQPYFKFDDKQDQLTSRSTAISEDVKPKNSTFQYLNESCNPKKMGELQKLLKEESTEPPKEQHQKQTYPPFYVPKHAQKVGVGIPIPSNTDPRELKGHSPMHSKPNSNASFMGYPLNLPVHLQKPMSQPPLTNKTFSGIPNKPNDPNSNLGFFNPNKTNQGLPGFGRFS